MDASIFDFWRAADALTAQEADRADSRNRQAPVYTIAFRGESVLPWQDPAHQAKRLASGMAWAYTVQAGLHDAGKLSRLLARAMGVAEDEAKREGQSMAARLFDLGVDALGMPQPQSFALSLAAWSAGQVLKAQGDVSVLLRGGDSCSEGLPAPDGDIPAPRSGFLGYDDLSQHLMQWVANECARMAEEGVVPDASWLATLTELVAKHCCFPLAEVGGQSGCRIRAVARRIGAEQEQAGRTGKGDQSDILCSFFSEDLRRISKACKLGQVGAGLSQFIASDPHVKAGARVDVRAPSSGSHLYDLLRPERFPVGRWPSDHALVFSQQLAINAAWDQLADGAGIFAVNGPPGTGKTTLLRDVVAAVVTRRAALMARSRTGHFGAKGSFRLGSTWVPYFPLGEHLTGHSIVVASSNNGAVENVTLELPGAGAVPGRVAKDARYFAELASSVAGKEAWALMAAPLGNRQNRTEFLSRFWWGSRDQEARDGLRQHLLSVAKNETAPLAWDDAVKRFRAAETNEKTARARLSKLANLPATISGFATRKASTSAALKAQQDAQKIRADQVAQLVRRKLDTEAKIHAISQQIDAAQSALNSHKAGRPGLLTWISTFGRSHREWWETYQGLSAAWTQRTSAREQAHSEIEALCREQDLVAGVLHEMRLRVEAFSKDLAATSGALERAQQELALAQQELAGCWPDTEAEAEQREKVAPWAEAQWTAAREAMFLAALDVHRAFIEGHATQMLANLNLASDWLAGRDMPPEMARTALDSLSLVVPVISTTFASVGRMFANIGQENIGWLLIDEAGQAQSAHAVGAIWRARRTLVVGDPLQLEPVTSIPASVEAALGHAFGVEERWWPSHSSAQTLADRSTLLGTHLEDRVGQPVWVGCPLRLHRRCDEPMFSISNTIAYGGMMVSGKPHQARADLPASTWVDVRGAASEGHWIEGEGQAVQELLGRLLSEHGADPGEIVLISPFRDCAKRLKSIAKQYGLRPENAGTVHTAQGKEADVVMLVLGGNPQVPGAKSWAAQRPNLLNVAVSRAKKRIYVFGDRKSWMGENYFGVLASALHEGRVGAAQRN